MTDYRPTDRDYSLGFYATYPALRDAVEIPEGFFSASREQKEVFAAVRDLVEASQPVNLVTIAEKCAGNGVFTYLDAITTGLIPITPEEFRRRILTQAVEDVGKRLKQRIASDPAIDWHEVAAQAVEADRLEQLAEDGTANGGGPRFVSTLAGNVQTRRVLWLWRDVVAYGMPTAIVGDPGIGKTFLCDDVTARVTRGFAFPAYAADFTETPAFGKVVYITSEGVPDRLLVPRLVAAGADLGRVEIITGIYGDKGEFKILDVSAHLPALARKLKADTDVRLVVIDPIASHMNPKLNTNSTLEMRGAMDEIARFAEDVGCAVVVVMHLNKDERKTAINRVSGSVQFLAAVKSAWAVIRKPDDENVNRRYFSPIKNNLAAFNKSLAFEIQGAPVTFYDGSTDEIGRVVWAAEPEDFDVQAAISPGAIELKSKTGAAVAFLREKLAAGPRMARELFDEAEAAGISKDTLWKAKRKENVVDGREGFGSPSMWHYTDKGGQK
jgi:putative DNA primase/helicase